jgi:dTDP-glucose 4,6-dehydratase
VYGDGSRTRAFCYVEDLVDGLCRLLFSGEVSPVNLGNPVEMTVLQFANKVLEVTGSTSDIVFVRPHDERIRDDPKMRQPDISKARAVLGWEPKITLDEGLRRTVDWFRDKV